MFKMEIFNKIEINSPVNQIIFDDYKYEMKLAIIVFVVCMLAMILVSYKSPVALTIGIIFQVLVFTKYLYDRRIKLKEDIKKFK